MNTQITIVAGLGYSDEGKGHIVQLLTNNTKNYSKAKAKAKYDIVMRTNGSWSSSHQVDISNKLKCFHLPSVINEEIVLIVGPGMYVYPNILLEELEQDFRKKQNIYICDECFVIEDEILQSYETNVGIGTLGSGVRNLGIKKLNHQAKKLKEIVNNENFTKLKKYLITDDEYFELVGGKNILVEGSHGYLIDCNFGIYPYTTSTNTTPSSIMGLTKFGPECYSYTIFVSGLILMSLSVHPDHKTYSQFGLEWIEDLIPDNIKYDYACGLMMKRNFGPFNFDVVCSIIRYYPKCQIFFTFFDIIDKIGIFHYIVNSKLEYVEKSNCNNFQEEIYELISKKLNTEIVICEKPFE